MNKSLDRFIASFVVFLAVISYFDLFQLRFIPNIIRSLSSLLVCGLMVVLIIIRITYRPGNRIKMNFAMPVAFLLLGSLPSYFMAKSFHDQSFIITAFANRILLFYLLYFFVHLYNVSIRFILRLIMLTGLFAVFLYYVQFIAYPSKIMDINMLEGRGTIRLFVPGMLCTQAAFFYFLNQFFSKNKLIYLILCLLTLSVFILQGTRQLIFSIALLTLINLLLSNRVRSKLIITFVLSLSAIAIFLIFREIFSELNKVSTSQAHEFGSGIRIKSAKFYLTTFMPHGLAYIFGNGKPALASLYDQQMSLYAFKYGFYIADIGIVGDYVMYGFIFTLAGLVMLIKAIRFKISAEYNFLKYYVFIQCFTLFTGYGILGGVDIILLLILYIFDVDRAEAIKVKTSEDINNQRLPSESLQTGKFVS